MRALCGVLGLVLAGGCAGVVPVHDGTSVARGYAHGGRLVNPVELPLAGDGYLMPRTWATRGLRYGTDELVTLVVGAARRVAADMPGNPLYVGDLSLPVGGPSRWHRSHQSGRDVDLLFYAVTADGRPPPPPDRMPRFDAEGRSPDGLVFDTARNWRLVRALLESPVAEVQFVFIADHLKDRLLAWASQSGEPADVIAAAQALLRQPSHAAPHDDHMHVRIYCPPSDRTLGCLESGPLRWTKKDYKYRAYGPAPVVPQVPAPVAAMAVSPFCRLLARPVLAGLLVPLGLVA